MSSVVLPAGRSGYGLVFGFLWKMLRQHPWFLTLTAIFAVVFAVGDLVIAQSLASIIDLVATTSRFDGDGVRHVWHLFGYFIGGFITYWGCRYAMFLIFIPVQATLQSQLCLNAFDKIQTFSAGWHLDSFAGATVRDIARGQRGFEQFFDTVFTNLLGNIVIVVSCVGYMLYKMPTIGVIIFVFAAVFLTVSAVISIRVVAPLNRKANALDSSVGGLLADAITCNIVVRSFGNENAERAKLADILRDWKKRSSKAWSASALNGASQMTQLLLLRFLLVGYVIHLWTQGHATVGDVTLVGWIAGAISIYLRDFGYQLRTIQTSLNDMDAVARIDAAIPDIQDRPDAQPLQVRGGEIAYNAVRFAYKEDTAALFDNVSVTVKGGQMVALVGPSGSGKSTFIKLIQRFYDVQGGGITIDGQDIRAVTQQSLRRAIAVVPQEPILFHRSLFDNIAYANPNATREQVIRAAERANAAGFVAKLPQGYDTLVGERGIKLSGGERQRIAIARAILADAPILILDEATSSLDTLSERLIQKSMGDLTRGRTTFVIAHRLSTIQAADRILVFDGGRIVEDGTHETLLALGNGVYQHLHDTQFALDEGL